MATIVTPASGAFDESAGFHPFGFGWQGFEVAHGVRNHGLTDALGPVQAGQRVNPVYHAFTGAQGPPQLVHDDEVVPARFQAGVGQGVGDLDGGEPGGPAGQQAGRLNVALGVGDP